MENWKFALKSILAHKMRSLLTMLGIIIGVSAVVVIVAMGTGMSKSIADSLGGDNRDVEVYFTIMASEEVTDGMMSGMVYEQVSQEEEPTLTEPILEGLRNIDGLDAYYTINNMMGDISFGKKKVESVTVTGVGKSYFDIK